ncbi:MAG TPA: hybrid sensor histidine kinase/response regulator [Chloroflexi bacterium]|nr:hybrid sensor histidine kinase/response regulator [Chloroflexota bacterium]
MESNVRVLVIDDSRHIRDFIADTLSRREGFTLLQASDGSQGVEMVLADPPDLIFCDLEMPHMDGFQVIDALRAQRVDVPIILITSHGSEAIAVEFFRKGVKDYMSKPFTADEMFSAIDRALTEVRLRREKEALTQHLALANQKLRQRVQEMDILYHVGKSVTSMLSKDQLLERILDAIFCVIEAEEATLMLMDEESGELSAKLHRQRVNGAAKRAKHRSPEALAIQAICKGAATDTQAMLSAPLKIGEKTVGVLGVGNCVSGQPFSKHDRQLLMALADYAAIAIENARLYEGVQQADQAKSEFVSLVAHELRTPMTSIRGYTDMLLKEACGPLAPQQAQFIQTIRGNVVRMAILVSDLQDISRIETGHMRLECQPTDLRDALHDALQATRGQIEARDQQFTVNIQEDLPQVHADPARLTQILINLLSNAYKYTPEGGRIRVRAWLQDDYVRCAISDTGIGISKEDQARLFTKFFRSSNSEALEKPGTGLGLCIVKNLVELHGGQIRVESQLGKGTTFAFAMPVAGIDV